ncbi:hypothetical protein ACMA1I_17670 [Pontibacter sp. 13R65]|uniref:hypothetical protein n=1 Tax=Pontibacter sp. 13R65 TaxID=3127458 RepID=UPI00301C3AFE
MKFYWEPVHMALQKQLYARTVNTLLTTGKDKYNLKIVGSIRAVAFDGTKRKKPF